MVKRGCLSKTQLCINHTGPQYFCKDLINKLHARKLLLIFLNCSNFIVQSFLSKALSKLLDVSVMVLYFFNRFLRSVAYRQFVGLVYGRLGKKRVPLPACTYTAIRRKFTSQRQDCQYSGYANEEGHWRRTLIYAIKASSNPCGTSWFCRLQRGLFTRL